MYKKAGIVVGILCFVLAIIVFVIVSVVTKQDEKPWTSSTPTTSAVTQTIKEQTPVEQTTQITQTTTTTNVTSAAQVAPVVTTTTTATEAATSAPEDAQQPVLQQGTLVLVAPEGLPANYTDTTDIGRVVGRNIYAYNGQVIYSLLINTTVNGQLEYFTTLKNYNIPDGTQVDCTLRVFTNSSGSTFPSVISVTTA